MFVVNPYKDWLLQLSNLFYEKKIVRFGNESFSANDLLARRNAACALLKKNNIIKGNHVAIIEHNSIEFVIELLSIWAIGAIPVPINLRLSEKEISEQLKFVDAKLAFSSLGNNQIPNIFENFKVIRSGIINNQNLAVEKLSWEIEPISTALLMFTSGSSGNAKCVELTFQNLISSAESVIKFLNPENNDSWLTSLPFYHIGGFSIIIRAFLSGNVLSIPKFSTFENISDIIEKGKANYISLVPTTLQRLLDAGTFPHKSIKTIFLGGARVPLHLVNNALKRGYKLTTVYGSTETASMIAADKLTGKKNRSSFAGKPLTGTEYFILDEFENRVAANEVGEIAVKSPSIAKGYFNNPKETKRKFHRENKGRLDYYLTSDLGKVDEHGHLFVLGRKDDVIISGGENISTSEITDKIKSLKEVADAFAFGLNDTQWGEKLVAAVVLRKLSGRELKNQLKELLPGYKIPKEIFIVNEIPRTSLGKVIKEKLLSLLIIK